MARELRLLEQFLLHLRKESVTNTIGQFASDCDLHVDESGSTYRWLGILRGAELHWKTSQDFSLFCTELEGIDGASPQIIFKTQDRYVLFPFVIAVKRIQIRIQKNPKHFANPDRDPKISARNRMRI
jgi:hypothetical protein